MEVAANMGELLAGDKLHSSAYTGVRLMLNETCSSLCTVQDFETRGSEFKLFERLVRDGYRVQMRLDNMPAVELRYDTETASTYMGLPGYPMGFVVDGVEDVFVNNHIDLYILYHRVDEATRRGTSIVGYLFGTNVLSMEDDVYRLVGFYVVPRSVAKGGCLEDVNTTAAAGEVAMGSVADDGNLQQYQPAAGDVSFTYSVIWRESDTRWRYRWEPLLSMSHHDVETNWFSITNAVLVITAISFVVAFILVRLLRRDLLRYAEIDELLMYDDIEVSKTWETGRGGHNDYGGWKSVSNDVFREPPLAAFLCVCVGTGVQVFTDVMLMLTISLTGVFSPANRGAFMAWSIITYALLGFVGGYNAALLRLKMAAAKARLLHVSLATALCFPGILFSTFFALNTMVWSRGSSGAVPISTIAFLLVLWLGVNLPSCFVGSFFAFRHYKNGLISQNWPTKTNLIHRAIPLAGWWQNRYLMGFMLGIVPFLVSFAQLFFVLSKMLLHQIVYMNGFLFVVFWLLTIASAEVSLIAVYTSLSCEDYRWWWQAFMTPAVSGLDMLAAMAIFFWTTFSSTPSVVVTLMLGHLFMLTMLWMLFTGAVGFVTSLAVINTIYAAVKAD